MTSLLSHAQWIASSVVGGPRTTAPAPYFRQTLTLEKPVLKARLQITARGLYEARLNDLPIGDQVFAPGWTEYRVRIPYQSYDVSSMLEEGENVLGVILGDGWYCGFLAWTGRQHYGDRPSLCCVLEVTFTDGSKRTISTDESWKTTTGPILESDLLMGESYDARLDLGAWAKPGYDDSKWSNGLLQDKPSAELSEIDYPPVRRVEEITPERKDLANRWPNHTVALDFRQNFTGRIRLTINAPAGTTITIRHAEILNSDGSLYTENLRTAKATDQYTCRGGGHETWEPRFTFHGFRYAEISVPKFEYITTVTGIVLHSDTRPTGSFSCSNPLLNQLQHNIVWGQKSNFLEVPTDCPQRDERLGWTGDAQVFIRTACFNMDVRSFFHKWTQDIRDTQKPNGAVPPVIPDVAMGLEDGGPAWADATIICPWTIFLCYADRQILADHYDSMEKFMEFMAAHRCKGYIRSHPDVDSWGGFGDWLALDGSGKTDGATARDLIGTAYYAYDAEIMSKVAVALDRPQDAAKYRELHQKIVEAFQHRFLTGEGLVAAGTQTAMVLALHFGLVPEALRESTATELVRDIKKRDFHIATGFVGTPYILDVLEENGHLDVAYKLLEQETFPSWLFPIKNGATTIWERWDGWTPEKGPQDKGMNSYNHYAYGAVGAWMYRTIAGIELDPEKPGYEHIIFRPRPGGTITWAKASLETPYGKTSIDWKIENEAFEVTITIPKGTRATFDAPEGYSINKTEFESGIHKLALAKSD